MKICRTLVIGWLAAATASVAGTNTSVQALGREEKIKLNGCLVKAEGDDGYLITNLPSEPGSSTADRNVATSAIGTSGTFSTVFYWLRDDDDLKVKSGGDELKAKVPNAYVFPDATRDKDRKISALVRKVDVDHVKMVYANCQ